MLFQRIQKDRGEPKISFLKFVTIFRPVHSCQIKDEITLTAILIQLVQCVRTVKFKDFVDMYFRMCPVLPVFDILQIFYQIFTHKSGSSRDQNLHKPSIPSSHAIL